MLCKSVIIHGLPCEDVVIPKQLTHTIVAEFHSAKGYQGTIHTFEAIQRIYWWPKLCQAVVKFISNCPLCAKHHLDMTKYAHLHIEIPKKTMVILAMDSIWQTTCNI